MSSMGAPQVRVRYMQTFLAHVRRLDPGARDAVLAETGTETVAAIDANRSFFAWLPAETNLDATRAVAHRLGPRQTHQFFVCLQEHTLETPLFEWVQRNAEILLGPDPARRLKWIAKAYGIMFNDAGTWEVAHVEETMARLEMVNAPAVMLHDRLWLDSVASSLHAAFPGGPAQTSVKLVGSWPEVGRAEYRVRWFLTSEDRATRPPPGASEPAPSVTRPAPSGSRPPLGTTRPPPKRV
jgi:hypothetical protein